MHTTIAPGFRYMGPKNAAKPKTRGKQKEGLVVNAAIRWLFAQGCYAWRNNTGGFKTASGRVVSYGLKGSADIVGVTPQGMFIAIECKSAKGRLTPEQRLFRDRIREKGGLYFVVKSVDDLEREVKPCLA
jgi:hypothetical protein